MPIITSGIVNSALACVLVGLELLRYRNGLRVELAPPVQTCKRMRIIRTAGSEHKSLVTDVIRVSYQVDQTLKRFCQWPHFPGFWPAI
jgi:hypothetical protein